MSASAANHAYLMWLKERGLRFPMPVRRPAAAPLGTDGAAPPTQEAAAGTSLVSAITRDMQAAPPRRRTRALLVADGIFIESEATGDAAMTSDERTLLDKMIAAMHLTPDDAVVMRLMPMPLDPKAPPPAQAVTQALQGLVQQVQNLRPEAVVLLGAWTARAVLGSKAHFPTVRGRLVEVRAFGGIPALVTFHPRDLLRFPLNKRHAWTDLQQLMSSLGTTATH